MHCSCYNVNALSIFPAEFRTAFELFDKDSSGAISADELGTVMRNLGLDPSQDEVRSMVELHDFDSECKDKETCSMSSVYMYDWYMYVLSIVQGAIRLSNIKSCLSSQTR